jgi:hypothetical protein
VAVASEEVVVDLEVLHEAAPRVANSESLLKFMAAPKFD